MKNRQFIVLCCLIVIQPLVCYIMFWYYSHYIDQKLVNIEGDIITLEDRVSDVTNWLYDLNDCYPAHWPVND